MKVVHQDRQAREVKLRPDSVDDLWHLSHLVESGDVAIAFTHRAPEEAREGGGDRAGKVEKKGMTLGVQVEKVEFHEFSTRLRILGVIVEGPQDSGMHHTLNIEPFTDVTIRKPEGGWKNHHFQRIKEAEEAAKRPLVTFLAIEENEAVVAALRQYGIRKIADILGHTSGKRYAQQKGTEDEFFDEILLALREARPEAAPLIVLGPGFAKERFVKYAKEKHAAEAKGAVIEPTGQAGMTGVHEALRRGVVDRVQEGQRVSFETKLVEQLLEGIATDGPVAYGPEEVRKALKVGAVETLLVSDELLREGGEKLMDEAQHMGGKAVTVSTRHEAGHKLRNFGGLGALLRYRVE